MNNPIVRGTTYVVGGEQSLLNLQIQMSPSPLSEVPSAIAAVTCVTLKFPESWKVNEMVNEPTKENSHFPPFSYRDPDGQIVEYDGSCITIRKEA